MSLFQSMPALHAQTIARMRSREALKAGVGAVIYATQTEAIQRGLPVESGIQSLNRDIRNNLVYADPVDLRKTAKQARDVADEDPLGIGDELKIIADRLDLEASINEDRASKIDSTTTLKQINYSTSFFNFKKEWDLFYGRVTATDFTLGSEISGPGILTTIDSYYSRYVSFYDSYKTFGYVPSNDPPPPSKVGDTELPDLGIGKAVASIPWDKIALFGVGALAVYWFINRKPPSYSQSEPQRLLGPPSHERTDRNELIKAHGG